VRYLCLSHFLTTFNVSWIFKQVVWSIEHPRPFLISKAFPVLILLRALLPLPCRWLSYSGLNEIQIHFKVTFLSTNFSYKRRFSSFYYVHATRKSCQNEVRTKNSYVKRWWNWHQIPFKVTCHFFFLNFSKFVKNE